MVDWLHAADAAYNRACQTHMMQGTEKYFCNNALSFILSMVNSDKKDYQGLDRYRRVEFILEKSDGGRACYRKHVTYANVKIQHGINVAVGEAYDENWIVVKTDGILKVHDIVRLNLA